MSYFNFTETVVIRSRPLVGNGGAMVERESPAIVLRYDSALNLPGTDDIAHQVEVLLPPESDVNIGDTIICYGVEYYLKSFRSCRDLMGKLRAWRLNGIR